MKSIERIYLRNMKLVWLSPTSAISRMINIPRAQSDLGVAVSLVRRVDIIHTRSTLLRTPHPLPTLMPLSWPSSLRGLFVHSCQDHLPRNANPNGIWPINNEDDDDNDGDDLILERGSLKAEEHSPFVKPAAAIMSLMQVQSTTVLCMCQWPGCGVILARAMLCQSKSNSKSCSKLLLTVPFSSLRVCSHNGICFFILHKQSPPLMHNCTSSSADTGRKN